VLIVLKSGSLNLLEPSGPVKACNGVALPLPYKDELTQQWKESIVVCNYKKGDETGCN
jgi:hypothetical protein